MLKKFLFFAAMAFSGMTYAADSSQVSKTVELKDGSKLFIFKDGKMGMEDRAGRSMYMAPGKVMETKDGKKVMMNGNELWRVEELLHTNDRGG